MSSSLVFVRFILLNLVSCVAFCESLFIIFLLVIIWSVFRLMAPEQSFGISKLFLLASYCIYVCIERYFTLKNNRNLYLQTVSFFEGFILFFAVTPKVHTVTDDIFTYILNMPQNLNLNSSVKYMCDCLLHDSRIRFRKYIIAQ